MGVSPQRWRRRSEPSPSSVLALERDFRGWLEDFVSARPVKYMVKASAGQPDRRYTLIPYAMVLRRDVTSSPTHGVYVALLFDEQCRRIWLTLNQGISQFRDRFGPRRSFAALRQAAGLLASLLPGPAGFMSGVADLNASNPFGKGYEAGAIYSRAFELSTFDEQTAVAFAAALREVLHVYDGMPLEIARDPSLAGNLRGAGEEEGHFQELVNHKASSGVSAPLVDVPRPPPKRRGSSVTNTFPRDPSVAAQVVMAAKHQCEAACTTEPFVASATGLPYVEAHHLIPLSEQDGFASSLDVPANVVALCAACHAKIHLAIKAMREPLIAALHTKRYERLKKCGLDCGLPHLMTMYRR